jgi:flagellar basal-body rod modification protein FlgD
MTTVTSATMRPASPAPANSSASKASLDYDAFLKLFMAQMKNQDPLNPNDPSQNLAQLASFSNVEQSLKLNEKLDVLISSSNATLASSLIGKRLSSADGSVTGIATSVETVDGKSSAVLDNGKKISLADGYRLAGA